MTTMAASDYDSSFCFLLNEVQDAHQFQWEASIVDTFGLSYDFSFRCNFSTVCRSVCQRKHNKQRAKALFTIQYSSFR